MANKAGIRKLWTPYYDSARHATTGHTALSFFIDPIGGGTSPHTNSGVKTKLDTNMKDRKFGPNQKMEVVGIRVKYKPTAVAPATQAADLQLIMNTGLLTIKVGDAVFIEQQLWDFNAGVGPAAGFAATTAATTSIAFAANGITQGENFWKLYELGFAIEEGEQIDAVMSWPAAVTITTATVITLQLEGRYTTNVVG